MQDQAHDRTRDPDVISAAYLLDRIAGERGVGVGDLVKAILADQREMNLAQSQAAYLAGAWADATGSASMPAAAVDGASSKP